MKERYCKEYDDYLDCDCHKDCDYHKDCDCRKDCDYHKDCDCHRDCDCRKDYDYHKDCDCHRDCDYHEACDYSRDCDYYKECDCCSGCDCSCCPPIIINCNNDNNSGETRVKAYGGSYNRNTQFVFFNAVNNYVQISLNTALPSHEVQVNDDNTLTVLHDGDYLVSYNILINANKKIDVAAAVRRNEDEIIQTHAAQTLSIDRYTGISFDARITVNTIVTLEKDDHIDLAIKVLNSLPTGLDAIISGKANATLYIKKIS